LSTLLVSNNVKTKRFLLAKIFSYPKSTLIFLKRQLIVLSKFSSSHFIKKRVISDKTHVNIFLFVLIQINGFYMDYNFLLYFLWFCRLSANLFYFSSSCGVCLIFHLGAVLGFLFCYDVYLIELKDHLRSIIDSQSD
jgi:hypothetical protein